MLFAPEDFRRNQFTANTYSRADFSFTPNRRRRVWEDDDDGHLRCALPTLYCRGISCEDKRDFQWSVCIRRMPVPGCLGNVNKRTATADGRTENGVGGRGDDNIEIRIAGMSAAP